MLVDIQFLLHGQLVSLQLTSITKFIKENGIEEKVKTRKLILPGKVAVLKGDLEENLPGWEIIVGTTEAMFIPKFLKEMSGK